MKDQQGIQIIKYTCLRIFFCSNYCVYHETLFHFFFLLKSTRQVNESFMFIHILCSRLFSMLCSDIYDLPHGIFKCIEPDFSLMTFIRALNMCVCVSVSVSVPP